MYSASCALHSFWGAVLVQFNTINLPLISAPFIHVIIAFYTTDALVLSYLSTHA
jgi:hypothetical protein